MIYEYIFLVAALNFILGLLVLFALRKHSFYFLGFKYSYQILFSLLASLICPTLLIAGHGAIPLPTLMAIGLLVLGRGSDYHLTFFPNLGLNNEIGMVWLVPTAVCFIAMYFSPWSKVKKVAHNPSFKRDA